MLRKLFYVAIFIIIAGLIYLFIWPVPVEPIVWKAPKNLGYTGQFAVNNRLKNIEFLSIGDNHGPEDIAIDAQGRIYVSTQEGRIVRLQPDGSNPENWFETGGRPLGIEFDNKGNLIIADAYKGLLFVSSDGKITKSVTIVDGLALGFTDAVDVADDGKIYFTDASTKFSAQKWGVYKGAEFDLVEHGGHGRLLVYDAATGKAKTLLDGLNFPDGVTVSHNQSFVLISEQGEYRVIRYWVVGPHKGQFESFIENLPSFPDNISTGFEGRFWVALTAPRVQLLDKLSSFPLLRKITLRLPEFIKPEPVEYSHIIAIDENGNVVQDLQDPDGSYPMTTGVIETENYLYIGSLTAPALGRITKEIGFY